MNKLLSDYFAFAIPGKSGCLRIGASTLHIRSGRVVGFACGASQESLIPQLVDQGLISDREARLLEWAGTEAGDAGPWTSVDHLLGVDASRDARASHLLERFCAVLQSGESLQVSDEVSDAGQDLGFSCLELPFHALAALTGSELDEVLQTIGPPFRRTDLMEPSLEDLGLPEGLAQQLHAAGPGIGGLTAPEGDPAGMAAFVVMWGAGLLVSESAPAPSPAVQTSAPIGMGTLSGMPRIRPPGASAPARPPSPASAPPPPLAASMPAEPVAAPSPFPPVSAPPLSAPPRMPGQRIKPPTTRVIEPLPSPDARPRAGTGRDRWTQSTGVRDAMPGTQDRPALREQDEVEEPSVEEGLPDPIWEAEEPAQEQPPEDDSAATDQDAMAILHEILELMRKHHVLSARDKLRDSGFSEQRQVIIERYLETLDPGSHDPGGAMNRALAEIQTYSQEHQEDFVAPLLLSRIYARADNEKLAKVFLGQARRLADG
ncbi:MAG: hypothetical protein CMH55_00170 [Myxococcales bacterium]|nr:hypothetical protein [Myxococcales bacterium]